jgi:CubicO group peptidase (beta-lactamase class C family)
VRPGRRQWRVAAAGGAVLAVVTAGCTGSPASQAPGQSQAAASATVTAPPRSKADLGKGIDVFFRDNYTDSYQNVRAVLVYADRRPVVERYYRGSASTTSNVQSVTKSVMSMLIGIALDEGHLRSVNQTLAELLPSYAAKMSPQTKAITLRQVLTMTAGLPPDPPGAERPSSGDWVATVVSRGPMQPPGRGFEYSSAGSHVLSAILAEATGQTVLEYARAKLFTPLGIDSEPAAEPVAKSETMPAYDKAGFAWPKDPQGYHLGFGYLKLTARDMATSGG